MEGRCLSGCFPVIKAKRRTGYTPFYPFMEKTGSLCMGFYRRRLIRNKACGLFKKIRRLYFSRQLSGNYSTDVDNISGNCRNISR